MEFFKGFFGGGESDINKNERGRVNLGEDNQAIPDMEGEGGVVDTNKDIARIKLRIEELEKITNKDSDQIDELLFLNGKFENLLSQPK